MARILTAGALVASMLAPSPVATGAPEPPPNILIIVSDDQRQDGTMGVMPRTRRWFRRDGRRFTNAYVTTPLCCPSRASIFSGRYAHNHGVQQHNDGPSFDHSQSLQRYLGEEGYLTGLAGRYLMGTPIRRDPPAFDRWAVFGVGHVRTKLNLNGRTMRAKRYATDVAARKAVNFLRWFERKDDDAPWLLFVTPSAPHAPYAPAPRHRKSKVPTWEPNPAMSEEDRSDKPPWVQEREVTGPTESIRAKQLRMLRSVDELVDRVMRELGRLRERRNTLAFYLSDNGLLWGEHGLRLKHSAYTQSMMVPLFMRWPGRVDGRSVDDRFVANIDLVPTALEAAGVQVPLSLIDGRSLLSSHRRDRALVELPGASERFGVPAWASLRTEEAQYTEYYDEEGEVVFREYYDLVADPWQLTNPLGDADPDNDPEAEAQELSEQLALDRVCYGTSGPTRCP